jgi:putative transposase
VSMRILAWCIMPNHWHLLLWPRKDGDLSNYMRLVTLTHTQRRHAHRDSVGTGHVYQGRFKSFVVQEDAHFLAVARYVEANAFSANLVARAEAWRWGSLWRVHQGREVQAPRVDAWPLPRPADWLAYANEPVERTEARRLRACAQRGSPYGNEAWAYAVAHELGLESTLRPRGRPAKEEVPDPFSAKRVLTPF